MLNVAVAIENLMFAKQAAENPNQSEPSRRYQQQRLDRARDLLHDALSEQIRECLQDFTKQLLDKGHGGV
jgi:hypothetical protein